jgi:hypothetical protein
MNVAQGRQSWMARTCPGRQAYINPAPPALEHTYILTTIIAASTEAKKAQTNQAE